MQNALVTRCKNCLLLVAKLARYLFKNLLVAFCKNHSETVTNETLFYFSILFAKFRSNEMKNNIKRIGFRKDLMLFTPIFQAITT